MGGKNKDREVKEDDRDVIPIFYPWLESGYQEEVPEAERMDEKELQELLFNTAPDDDY